MACRKPRYQANETYVSAKQNQARTHTRLPCPHGDESRTPRLEAPPRERPRPAHAAITAQHSGYNSCPLAGSSLYRLQKENRLLNAAAFGRVFKKATRSRDKWFTVLCRTNDTDIARLGLAISKKNCRQATGRNRIKRVVRESFRQHQAEMAGLDVVVINQPAAKTAGNRQLFDSMSAHWQRCQKARDEDARRNDTNG